MSTARIFISYASEDREDAAQVSAALQAQGHEVWWDRQLIAGDDFALKIEQQLDEADLVVVLWSQASAKSQFVRDEANRALQAGKLVPVRMGDLWPLPPKTDLIIKPQPSTITALPKAGTATLVRPSLAASAVVVKPKD